MESGKGLTQFYETPYEALWRRLMINFYYPVSHVIVVWCPSAEVDPGFTATKLGSRDPEVLINNH